jgi:hypothetical protein
MWFQKVITIPPLAAVVVAGPAVSAALDLSPQPAQTRHLARFAINRSPHREAVASAFGRSPVIERAPSVTLSSPLLGQGEVELIVVSAQQEIRPVLTWFGREVTMLPNGDRTRWRGFLPAGLDTEPGTHIASARIQRTGGEVLVQTPVTVVAKDYGTRVVTLPGRMVELSAPDVERSGRESAVLAGIWQAGAPQVLWQGPFIRQVPGEVIGIFGRKSILNGRPRAPHTGVDLGGRTGTPVLAANAGVVVLSARFFFTGNTVIIDHGGGVFSMYCHLAKSFVTVGRTVGKGAKIGLVGMTGRATGPHLHFAVRVDNVAVDPIAFVKVSEQFEDGR